MPGYWTVADERFSTRQQAMYLLCERRRGRRPTTGGGPETLEIMCNLIFTQNKRRSTDREAAPQRGSEEWTAGLGQACPPKDCGHSRVVPGPTHSSDTCINGVLAQDCRC